MSVNLDGMLPSSDLDVELILDVGLFLLRKYSLNQLKSDYSKLYSGVEQGDPRYPYKLAYEFAISTKTFQTDLANGMTTLVQGASVANLAGKNSNQPVTSSSTSMAF